MAELLVEVLGCLDGWCIASTLWPAETAPALEPSGLSWRREHTHSHPYREVLVPLTGSGYYGAFGTVIPCMPGTFLLFDSGDTHDNGYPATSATMDHLWITIMHGHYIARHLRIEGSAEYRIVNGITLEKRAGDGCFDAAWSHARSCPQLPRAVRRARLIASLAILLSRLVEELATCPHPARASSPDTTIQAICDHLLRTAGRDDTLDSLARAAGYSKYHFLRLFQRVTGTAVHAFIDECRTQKRSRLLDEGYSKKQIAFELGFSCPSAFSRWETAQGLRE